MEIKKVYIPIIVGATAIGKTSLSIKLAKKINGQIISADSMQIYKHMDIGTAKISKDEMENIPHHLLDIANPWENFSVSDFVMHARKSIQKIIEQNCVPIIVGGTGLYINSLISGLEFEDVKKEDLDNYRNTLEAELQKTTLEKMWEKANQIDPQATSKVSKNDKKRIFRILEIYHFTNQTKTQIDMQRKQSQTSNNTDQVNWTFKDEKNNIQYDIYYRLFNIVDDRPKLYEKIEKRMDLMFEQGLIKEVENIIQIISEHEKKEHGKNHVSLNELKQKYTSLQAIGYKEVLEYLEGTISKEQLLEDLKKDSRHYAKRQITWFKKNNAYIIDKNIIPNEDDQIKYIESKLN